MMVRTNKNIPKYNIFTIDGGGMKGLISAIVIEEIEKEIQKHFNNKNIKISDCFDMIAGTSTGAILAAMYLVPDEKGRPKYRAKDATKLYLERGKDIFSRNVGQCIKTSFGLTGSKYSCQALYNILGEYLGNIKISDVLKPCLITAYDITSGTAFFFDTYSAKKNMNKNYYLKDAVLASTAAPTFFPPVKVVSIGNTTRCLIDGGVCCNNPSVCAFTEALKNPGISSPKEISICSVGNVGNDQTYLCDSSMKWGLLGWVKPAINIMMDARKQIEDYELMMLYDSLSSSNNYLRLEKKENAFVKIKPMDDTSQHTIKMLSKYAYEILDRKEKEIKKYIETLEVG